VGNAQRSSGVRVQRIAPVHPPRGGGGGDPALAIELRVVTPFQWVEHRGAAAGTVVLIGDFALVGSGVPRPPSLAALPAEVVNLAAPQAVEQFGTVGMVTIVTVQSAGLALATHAALLVPQVLD